METKICTKCKIEKPITEFDFDRSEQRKPGYRKPSCKKCRLELKQKYCATNTYKKKRRDYDLKKRYNISLNDYDYYYHIQNGRCAICSREAKLVVDHNHKTGAVRELLCNNCNMMIGHAKENMYILQEAVNYIIRHNSISS